MTTKQQTTNNVPAVLARRVDVGREFDVDQVVQLRKRRMTHAEHESTRFHAICTKFSTALNTETITHVPMLQY